MVPSLLLYNSSILAEVQLYFGFCSSSVHIAMRNLSLLAGIHGSVLEVFSVITVEVNQTIFFRPNHYNYQHNYYV